MLAEDIERAGAGHCYPPAVRQSWRKKGRARCGGSCWTGSASPSTLQPDGDLSLALEGGHSQPRIIHAADATGRAIELGLLNALRSHPNITLLTGHTAVDLLTPSHHSLNRLAVYDHRSCVGAYVLEQATGQVRRIIARTTVLASGGLGQIFLRTTNPSGSRGDGIAMAHRAGVRIINAEFVQFHPTAFYHRQAARFLISEAVRGAGARLVDAQGQPFHATSTTPSGRTWPRVMSWRAASTREMLKHDVPSVYLDLRSYVSQDEIRHHFPTI